MEEVRRAGVRTLLLLGLNHGNSERHVSGSDHEPITCSKEVGATSLVHDPGSYTKSDNISTH
jgi:hypothetical protein